MSESNLSGNLSSFGAQSSKPLDDQADDFPTVPGGNSSVSPAEAIAPWDGNTGDLPLNMAAGSRAGGEVNPAADPTLCHSDAPPSDGYTQLLDELARTQSLECQHIRRIYQLEKALDQALIYLEELKLKVRDHEDLQDQLSMTEDFAYVQQHAIAHLKSQLNQQRQILISQSSEARDYDEAVQGVLGETEQLVEYQQVELEHLKVRLAQDLAEEYKRHSQLKKKLELLQSSLKDQQSRAQRVEADALAARTLSASLEIQLTASQQQVKNLSIRLAESQTRLVTSQHELKQAQHAADENRDLSNALKKMENVVAEQTHTIARLKRDLAIAETTVARLDEERTRGLREQVEWQKRCRELEAECDRHQTVLADLDQHNAEIQEEIVQQTRQVGEYEAAIQFWKERYLSSQRQLSQLKQLLEREAPHLSENAAEDLIQAVKLAMQPEEESPATLAAVPSPQFNTVDMPEFLIRRYALRNRSLLNRGMEPGGAG